MSKIEAENRQQKQELSQMKTKINDNKMKAENLLDTRVSRLEISEKIPPMEVNENEFLTRPKRPFRLVPVHFPR